MLSRVAAVLAFTLVAAPAPAAVFVDFREVGADLVATLSGSLDLTGATQDVTSPHGDSGAFINPKRPHIVFPNPSQGEPGSTLLGYKWWRAPGDPLFIPGFGDKLEELPGTYSDDGDAFIVAPAYVFLSPRYESGDELSGTFTFLNHHTFAEAGLTPGSSHVYYLLRTDTSPEGGPVTMQGDTVTIRILPTTPIPLPATALLLVGGLAGLAGVPLARRRRR